MPRVKKILLWVLLAFAVYAVITSPTQAADIVHTTWAIVVEAVTRIGDFFNALLNRK
jgi:hypothetical protein